MNETILVTGASGKFAGLIVPALVVRGSQIRGMVHNPADIAAVQKAGVQDVVVGDLTDPASVARALKGVSRVFYVAPVALEGEAEAGKAFVAAAMDAKVRRIVFSSIIHPVLSALPNHAKKIPVEEAILNSSLEYTFLHPTVLFQNFAGAWDTIVKTGVVAEPWSNETRFSRVDYRDVAEAAAIALTEDRLLYGTFELCAEGWLNRNDVATLMGAVLGRTITARRIESDTLPASTKGLRPMFDHYDHFGLLGNKLTLAAILGREPRTLRAYFEELAARAPPSSRR